MEFYAGKIKDDFTGNLLYDKQDSSFIYESDLSANFSIMVGGAYLGLDIDLASMKVQAISGYSPMHIWVKSDLVVPTKVEKRELYVKTGKQWHVGEGTSYAEWAIYFDSVSKWVCLGEKERNNYLFIEFAHNCFAGLLQGQIKAIYLKPQFI